MGGNIPCRFPRAGVHYAASVSSRAFASFRSRVSKPSVNQLYALLMAIIGGPDAGKVDWHPSVLEEARKTGPECGRRGEFDYREAPRRESAHLTRDPLSTCAAQNFLQRSPW